MTDRYANIRRALAMGPTPGPWRLSRRDDWHGPIVQRGKQGGFVVHGLSPAAEDADAALIAACDPDTIRELMAERDALAEGLTATEKDVAVAQAVEFAEYVERQAKGTMRDAAKRFLSLPYSQEIAERLKERDALARRCEWLRENPHVRVDQFGGKYRASTAAQILTDWLSSYDEAIDAAIAAANGGGNG